jgi:hypothetical protein
MARGLLRHLVDCHPNDEEAKRIVDDYYDR